MSELHTYHWIMLVCWFLQWMELQDIVHTAVVNAFYPAFIRSCVVTHVLFAVCGSTDVCCVTYGGLCGHVLFMVTSALLFPLPGLGLTFKKKNLFQVINSKTTVFNNYRSISPPAS